MATGEKSVTASANFVTLRRVPWHLSDVAIGAGVLGLFQAVAVVAQARQISIPRSIYWSCYFGPLLVWTVFFPLWIARRRSSAPLLWRMPSLLSIVTETMLAAILTFLMAVTIGVLVVTWQDVLHRPFPNQGPFGEARGAPISFLLVYAAFGATIGPACEELFFRGFVYNALRQRLGRIVGMIIQAVIFALLHDFSIAQRVVVFGIGVALACIYEWRKTLFTPVVVHCFFNTFVLAFGLIAIWRSPYLGVTGTPRDEGCQITSIAPDSPADKAELEVNDIIVTYDGQPVHSIADVAKLVSRQHAGDVVYVQILRDNQPQTVRVTLERRPQP
jgi:membrane protease YdiL (CAAX protease family)